MAHHGKPKAPRFILCWEGEHERDRDARRVFVGLEKARAGIEVFLHDEQRFNEESDSEVYEDSCEPALLAFIRDAAEGDLASWLARMQVGETEKFACEGGKFLITRDR